MCQPVQAVSQVCRKLGKISSFEDELIGRLDKIKELYDEYNDLCEVIRLTEEVIKKMTELEYDMVYLRYNDKQTYSRIAGDMDLEELYIRRKLKDLDNRVDMYVHKYLTRVI